MKIKIIDRILLFKLTYFKHSNTNSIFKYLLILKLYVLQQRMLFFLILLKKAIYYI